MRWCWSTWFCWRETRCAFFLPQLRCNGYCSTSIFTASTARVRLTVRRNSPTNDRANNQYADLTRPYSHAGNQRLWRDPDGLRDGLVRGGARYRPPAFRQCEGWHAGGPIHLAEFARGGGEDFELWRAGYLAEGAGSA